MKRRFQFTITGLLVAMTVVAIVCLILRASSQRNRQQKIEQAHYELEMLTHQFARYAQATGRLPNSTEGQQLLTRAAIYNGPRHTDGLSTLSYVPNDPWGNPYCYRLDASDSIRLWSFGPDGQDDLAEFGTDDVRGGATFLGLLDNESAVDTSH